MNNRRRREAKAKRYAYRKAQEAKQVEIQSKKAATK